MMRTNNHLLRRVTKHIGLAVWSCKHQSRELGGTDIAMGSLSREHLRGLGCFRGTSDNTPELSFGWKRIGHGNGGHPLLPEAVIFIAFRRDRVYDNCPAPPSHRGHARSWRALDAGNDSRRR
jgi:hypothetical protein